MAFKIEINDLIRRSDALECFHDWVDKHGDVHTPDEMPEYRAIEALPSAQPKPCEDAVSRKAVYEAMVEKGQHSRRYKLGEIWELNGDETREALDTVPSAQPQRKTGKWIVVDDAYNRISGKCSVCGWEAHMYEDDVMGMDYCPNCGARLEGEGC